MKSKKHIKRNVTRTAIDGIRYQPFVPAWKKWRDIGDLVLSDLRRRGQFFSTPQGLFFFDNDEGRIFSLTGDIALAALINQRYGVNPQEHGFKRVLADLQSEATSNGTQIEVRRLAHYEKQTNCLYVSRFNGKMYKLDGSTITEVPNGEDNVFFFDDVRGWEPYSYAPNAPRGLLDRTLIQSVHFEASALTVEEQQMLFKFWFFALFFGAIQPTKIILLLLGEYGSGKSLALRRIQKLIFGAKANLLSIEQDKQDGFIATITTDPIALFDNLDERIKWLPYNLSRLATGVTFPRRQLYTTNDKVEFPGVSWLGITARSVDFMNGQRDLPDRTLVLRLRRLQDRKPESELLAEVEAYRDKIWSELLDELNLIVGQLKQNIAPATVRFRMADFASLALRMATVWHCRPQAVLAFSKLESAQAELVPLQPPPVQDPLSDMLVEWLQNPANLGRAVTTGSLFLDLTDIARRRCVAWPVPHAKSLGQCLTRMQAASQSRFKLEISYDAHDKQNVYQLWPGQTSGGLQPAPAAVNSSTDSPELEAAPSGPAADHNHTSGIGLSGVDFERFALKLSKAA